MGWPIKTAPCAKARQIDARERQLGALEVRRLLFRRCAQPDGRHTHALTQAASPGLLPPLGLRGLLLGGG